MTSDAGRFRRPVTSTRRWPCWPTTPTPRCSPAAPTGASRSTCAASGRRTSWRSTGCPSCASSRPEDDVIEIGAALTLSEVEAGLAGAVPLLDEVWPLFASRLIRNGATIGGNIGTASPIGDLPPALLALEAVVVLSGVEGDREVPLADYFTGYRETALAPRGADPRASGSRGRCPR